MSIKSTMRTVQRMTRYQKDCSSPSTIELASELRMTKRQHTKTWNSSWRKSRATAFMTDAASAKLPVPRRVEASEV
jgi:hypothetical protein